jgi:hypothetical protein
LKWYYELGDGTNRVYPLRTFSDLTGVVSNSYASSDQYFRVDFRFEGTVFNQTSGVTTGPVRLNFTDYTGYGLVLVTTSTPDPAVWDFANDTQVACMASVLIKVPMNCDPGAYFEVSCAATTVTNASMTITAVTQLSAIQTSYMPTSYPKNKDGTINHKLLLEQRVAREKKESEEDDGDSKVSTPLVVEVDSLCVSEAHANMWKKTPQGLYFTDKVANLREIKKVKNPGEAKNPGPTGRLQVHNCTKQLAFLQGYISKGAVVATPRRVTRDAKARSMVQKKLVKCPPQGQDRSKQVPKNVFRQRTGAAGKPLTSRQKKKKLRRLVAKATLLHEGMKEVGKKNKQDRQFHKKTVRYGEAKNPGPTTKTCCGNHAVRAIRYQFDVAPNVVKDLCMSFTVEWIDQLEYFQADCKLPHSEKVVGALAHYHKCVGDFYAARFWAEGFDCSEVRQSLDDCTAALVASHGLLHNALHLLDGSVCQGMPVEELDVC